MHIHCLRCGLLGLLLCITARPGEAQVVQLPTQRAFALNTTVSVPDGGQTMLGGVDRARSATLSRGVPAWGRLPALAPGLRSRGHAYDLGSSRASVRATVIDLQAMDEALLAQAAARVRPTSAAMARQRKAEFLTRHVARDATQPAPRATGG